MYLPDPSSSEIYVTPYVREPHTHTRTLWSHTCRYFKFTVRRQASLPMPFLPGPLILSPRGEIPSQSFKSVQHKSCCFCAVPSVAIPLSAHCGHHEDIFCHIVPFVPAPPPVRGGNCFYVYQIGFNPEFQNEIKQWLLFVLFFFPRSWQWQYSQAPPSIP